MLLLLKCVVIVLVGVLAVESSLIDDEYDEVFVERYLFSTHCNESSYWRKLDNIRSSWQVQSLPEYHSQSSKGFWFLNQKENQSNSYQMSFMSIEQNSTISHLININISSNGTYLFSSSINEQSQVNWTCVLLSPMSIRFVLCDVFNASLCSIQKEISFPQEISSQMSRITSALLVNEHLFFGSDSGFHSLNIETDEFNFYINSINEYVSSLTYSSTYKTLFIGTNTKLWIQTFENSQIIVRFEHINGLIDAPITSLVYDSIDNRLWIGQSTGITYLYPIKLLTGKLHWYFVRLSGEISNPGATMGHLPYANLTTLTMSNDNSIWLGSIYGLIRFNNRTSNRNDVWRVFNSGRYLPNRDQIVDIHSITVIHQTNEVIAVTNRGLTRIQIQKWTLQNKAQYFQNLIDKSNRHNRYNYIADCSMSSWANPLTCVKQSNDNDGLWTSMYLASQIFRYQITKDAQVQVNAWKHFEALKLLNEVTGIRGYPSRSIAVKGEYPPRYDWYSSPVNQSLDFEGDTSSDEMVGHQMIYPLVADLLAINEQQRLQAFQLLENQVNGIVDNDYYLIGENHNHTTWGLWNPREINNNTFYQETRGLNSLQILSFLFQIYSFTHNESYLKHIEYLIDEHGYDINLINQKMIAICDIDYSDDELAYLSYFSLINAFQRLNRTSPLIDSLKEYLFIGLELSHQYKQMEKSPFYNFIFCFIVKQMNFSTKFNCSQLISDSIWYLQRFPLDLINYNQYNSQRLDVQLNKYASCDRDGFYSLNYLPPNEKSIHKWNDGPFDLDGGDGFQEEDPSVFLLPYWGVRYFLFVENNE